MRTLGYAAHSPDSPLVPYSFERRDLRENDVAMEVLYCGVCHSDLHMIQNDWNWIIYPIVPGHEIIGHVIATGSKVTRYKTGDAVAVCSTVPSSLSDRSCLSMKFPPLR